MVDRMLEQVISTFVVFVQSKTLFTFMLKVLTEIWNQLCSLNNSSIRLVVGSHCYVCNSSIVHVVTKEGDFRVCKRIITRSCWIVWKGQHAIITIHATFLPLCPIALDCVVSSILAII